ncbi:MAG: hypothetical protein QOF61_2238, partial [Acidobacteriota bacterium]|nr:hypothetical protein [Acidobacteriota bacterium]
RAYPAGKYREFLEYLRSDHVKLDEPCRLRLLAMTSHWHAHYLRSELRNAFVLLTLLLVLLLGVGTLAAAIVLLLKWLGGSGVSAVVQRAGFVNLDEMLTPSWKNVSAILVLLAGLSGVTKFLRDYLGDVQTWTTYEETNEKFEKRKSVLKMSTDLLRFILEDDECDRMVVVAHSLGTTIAHDALLQLGRYNRARKDQAPLFRPIPLDKLDLLITFGSPVDKVHYFFESYAGRYHRYNRVSETLRGDIGEIPFAKNRQRNMHWINFWDQGDIISSSLETPSNRLFVDLAVDNTQVSSFVFPAPGASHSAYFDHRRVVGVMFDAIFNGKYSFHNPPRDDNHRPNYDAQMVGAGARLLVTKPLQVLMTLLPWLVLVTVASHLTTSASARAITLFLSTATAASLLVSWLYSRLRGHLARF